ncbi:MAG: DNA-binding protein [Chryseobacterium sp.]|nr:MAG: DNA-binding protein [Chryseobacterium sp.]
MDNISFEDMPRILLEIYKKVEHLEILLTRVRSIPPDDQELMTVQEAAKFLKITVPAIYTKVSRREIPVNKPGRRLYFSKSELRNWARGGRLKTQIEMHQDAELKMKGYNKRFKS